MTWAAVRPVALRSRVRLAPASWAANSAAALLQDGVVGAVAGAVGQQHVQVLARLVAGPAGVDVAGHLGQAGLDGGGEPAVALDDPPPAAVGRW